ncbi:MAG: GtrA family protein [Bacilli bacterium]|nr:GtrA family protein [Bacilli bacterium]
MNSLHIAALRLGRYARFLLVGAGNAAVDLLALNILLLIWPSQSWSLLLLYNTIAVFLSIVNSYVWNRLWTFADTSNGSLREKWLFLLQAVVNILVNDLILVWLSSYFNSLNFMSPFVQNNAAKGVAMLASSSMSYFLMRFLIFRITLNHAPTEDSEASSSDTH